MAERMFEHIPSYPAGSVFLSRSELSQAGVHRPTRAGIAGSAEEGATSIVLSGGYEDDEDWGDEILYTGQGGRDLDSSKQIRHQALNRANMALAKSKLHGLPVRVIRGARHVSPYSPQSLYRLVLCTGSHPPSLSLSVRTLSRWCPSPDAGWHRRLSRGRRHLHRPLRRVRG